MEKISDFVRWLFWGWWHGESVSAYDTKRALQANAPVFEIGSLRIPRWVLYLIGVIVLLGLVLFLVFSVGKITLVSEAGLSHAGLTPAGRCYATDSAGRFYVALDCMMRAVTPGDVVGPIILFAIGFACGYVTRERRSS